MKDNTDHGFDFLEAVIFDWAGTTVDFGCHGPVQAFVDTFAAFGVVVSNAEARAPMGMGKRDHVAAMCSVPRIGEAWRNVYGVPPTEPDIYRMYAYVESVMTETIHRYSTPIAGVVEAVRQLRDLGLRIGSCTGYPSSVAAVLAEGARRNGFVPDTVVCASDVAHGRPAPDMCLEAMRRLNVSDPARSVKIGDTVNDVLEGTRAGMWTIGITLSGSMAGLTEGELAALSEAEKWKLHERISDELTEAGAHFTAQNLPTCVETLHLIDKLCLKNFKPESGSQ